MYLQSLGHVCVGKGADPKPAEGWGSACSQQTLIKLLLCDSHCNLCFLPPPRPQVLVSSSRAGTVLRALSGWASVRVREGTSGSYRAGRLHGGTLAKLEHLVQERPGQRTFLCRYTAGEVGETWGKPGP